ncbi:hypothetical protein GCK72_015687 [Caenorhabditis remanei]|uniref:Delta-like protein n=1 Tax=Caenorhabditis remanei TaxID=31234 RepID=A0A6A5GX76_CAERE|nr:hypothetical protein GCK72_015687 [Caenorhabditis remanei]KAF1759226.1 hypothetical protein GCK72_015687 [Caenorhabditis remanei]
MPHIPLLLLFLQYPLIQAGGYLELRLKSAFPLNATVEITEGIYFPTNKRVYSMPLVPDETRILTNVPVRFRHPGTVLVNSGPVEKFGLEYETIRSERWNTIQMTIGPDEIHLPFTGFRIDIKCDRNWYGAYCDQFCNADVAKTINRRCTDSGTLGCPDHYYGPNCDKLINHNWRKCQCQNGGFCVSSFSRHPDPTFKVVKDQLICECPLGFEGGKCEKESYEYAEPITVEMFGRDHKWDNLQQFYNRSLVENELRDLDRF